MPPESNFSVECGRRQLFIDGYGVAASDQLEWNMHQPSKKGAVIRAEGGSLQTRSMPAWDPDKELFKLWVYSEGADTVYQSQDGLHWTPAGGQSVNVAHVVRDDLDPIPFRRYKGVLLNDGFVFSPDGHRWRCPGAAPVQSSDEGNLSCGKEGLFIHTAKRGGTYGRSVAIATSRDFKIWEDYGVVFQTDEVDQDRCGAVVDEYMADSNPLDVELPAADDPDWAWLNVDVYNMGVFEYEGIYIGLPAVYFRRGKRYSRCIVCFTSIELTCSRNLTEWTRLGDRRSFIPCSKPGMGAYDLSKNLPPSNAVVRGDEIWFYYTGIKYQGSQQKTDRDGAAVCLAVLRRDGFVSMDAGEWGGTLTTEPFAVPGERLFVNVDAYPARDGWYWRYGASFREEREVPIPELQLGELRVEVLDDGGKVVAVSAPVRGDQPRARLEWVEGDVAGFRDRTVRLRFGLRDARFYSYWFE